MIRTTDLERLVRGELARDDFSEWEFQALARELIAARKVVEAARLAIPATDEPLSYHAALCIATTLAAYDEATS